MPRFARARRELRARLWRPSVADEVADELDFHIEMRVREYLARGIEPEEARARALARFGDIREVRDVCHRIGTRREREMRFTETIGTLRQDATFALRQLAKARGFTAVAALTLALGIGATTAIFSVVNSVILRPLPFAHPDRVVSLHEIYQDRNGSVSAGAYADFRELTRSFEHMAAAQYASVTATGTDTPERLVVARVTDEFFQVFGVPAALGRAFLPEEVLPGGPAVVILSNRLWQRRFGGDAGVLGKSLPIDGVPHTIIGVMPARFDFVENSEDFWTPLRFTTRQLAEHDPHSYQVVALLEPGVSLEAAQRDLQSAWRTIQARNPGEINVKGRSAGLITFSEELLGDYRERMFVLLGAVGLVLLIACGNVANLLLARGAARAKEIAVRTALGAGRGRIVRQLLTESLVLALLGGALGLLLAWAGVRAFVAVSPPGVPRLEQAGIDPAMLAFAALVALASVAVFGLAPALRAARTDVQSTLREGGRRGGTGVRDSVRSALVVGEVALALTLLVGAGLLVRSAQRLQRVDPGIDPRGVLTARLKLPTKTYDTPEAARGAFEQVVERLSAAPGVRAAALVSQLPFRGGRSTNGVFPEGRDRNDMRNLIDSRSGWVTPGYFAALRIPLVRGRLLDATDLPGAPRAVVVNETFAEMAFPGQNAVGRRIYCCGGDSVTRTPWDWTIVGIVRDVRAAGLASRVPDPQFYISIAQMPAEGWNWTGQQLAVVVRGDERDPAALAPILRDAVRALDPSLPVYDIATMEERIALSGAQTRFNTLLLSALGLTGLLLAAVGIYGVVAYLASQRTYEIGVRLALGATARDVLRLVVGQGMLPLLAGLVLGTLLAMAATRFIAAMLFDVPARDPFTFAAVVVVLILAGLVSSYFPARRASRVSPTLALHDA